VCKIPLFDRICQTCKYKEVDRFEQVYQEPLIECPECGALTFAKLYSAPKLPPSGLYSFHSELDRMRQAASEGHGTKSYRL
jgi:predicted nucleic acid-binding Zn ribbon protein